MTNSNLITVFNGTIAHQPVQLCNARHLHHFVESKQEYASWIKNRIADYGFVQDEDYLIVTERTNGRPRKEYHITLDMGKELAMVERNEKGRQIRKYFIACEKAALQQQPQQPALPEPKTITLKLTETEAKSFINVWMAFTRFREAVYFLLKSLTGLQSKQIDSVKFNHDYLETQIRETHPLIRELISRVNKQTTRKTVKRLTSR